MLAKTNYVRTSLLFVLCAVVGFSVGIYVNLQAKWRFQRLQQQTDATLLVKPKPMVAFTAEDDTGQRFSEKQFRGHWTLWFFGFTHCPDLCPTTMTELHKFYELLRHEHPEDLPQVVLMTIDPERDDLARLHQYVRHFNEAFVGLRASPKTLHQLTNALGLVYLKTPHTQQASYAIDHSGSILLVDPKGRLRGYFSMPHNAAKMVHDYQMIKKTL